MTHTPPDFENPDWLSAGRVHEWKNYISDEVREMRPAFTSDQRAAIARQADELASREDWD